MLLVKSRALLWMTGVVMAIGVGTAVAQPTPPTEETVPEEGEPPAAEPPAAEPAPTEEAPPEATGQSGLRLHFVTTNNTYAATAYDIFDADTKQVVASGKGALEASGEAPPVWELEPGVYKIVRAGEPFDAPTDYVTAVVEPNRISEYVIIVEPTTNNFRGGGPLVGELPSGVEIAGMRLALNGGGTLLFSQSQNAVGLTSGSSMTVGLFGHFGLVFDRGAHFLDVAADVQLNLTDQPWASPYSTTDRFEGSAIYTYKLNNPYVGPYIRAGFQTRIFPGYLYLQSDGPLITVTTTDVDGVSSTQQFGTEANADNLRVKLSEPFAPFMLQEEIGGNLKAVDIDLILLKLVVGTRLGFGFRQGITNGLLVVDGDEDGGIVNLIERGNYQTLGPLLGASAQVTVARWLFGSARFGVMIPMQNSEDAGTTFAEKLLIDLAGTAGLKIPAFTDRLFASLDYTFRLERDGFISPSTQFDHSVMARANITLF